MPCTEGGEKALTTIWEEKSTLRAMPSPGDQEVGSAQGPHGGLQVAGWTVSAPSLRKDGFGRQVLQFVFFVFIGLF